VTIFYGFIILYHDREINTIDFRLKSSIFFKDNDLLISRKEESLPTISIRQDRGTCFLCARLPCDAHVFTACIPLDLLGRISLCSISDRHYF